MVKTFSIELIFAFDRKLSQSFESIDKGERMAIVGYARVSTQEKNLDAQLEQLQGVGCEKIFQEKESGANSERQHLAAMLDYVRSGDTVVVTKLDRIARSTKHLLQIVDQLQEDDVTFKVLNIQLDTGTPTGKLMLTMLGAIATFEREMMLERQVKGFIERREKDDLKGESRLLWQRRLKL